ncbi:Helix-turn-helix domain-containing protein [Streptoalloteichus tenebrarius]|uniref:Helix-turn-helix domain-containing protein n=1 Tax=Streptoalloteichus tenebrarius (strain ATCC 17920 / DSM 40477 / JCM 4838 / CBS 697.72 / NBRC 16177 / NCIMB 11028 / NRRL B-12390 / A12253. 1 / ISP 5477) TaxID=1933 RepID=A0ABT1I4E8_STRSD|nr:helix-turn-helix transcriptional regulator [Streptoalloteichus tenebrarius]MCP2262657.1 Helix-turn-helix domain-containing protein [Streptoalloteichus tenebrarius]
MPYMSPTVATWELALRLRQRREQLGMEVATLATSLGFTRNYWSAVENERKILSVEKLTKALSLLEFDVDEQRELLELREFAKQRGWWANYSALFTNELGRFYGLEQGAQSIRTYESMLVPGLLQTEEYARALISSDRANIRQVEVEQRVEIRMRRQACLKGDNPLHLTAVISQAALLQQTGGPQTLRAQLAHLVNLIEGLPDTLHLHVIPFTASGCGVFGASTFHLIDFASPRLPTRAWQETVTAAGIIDDPDQVRDLSLTHEEARQQSLDLRDSLDLIKQCHQDLA